MDTDEQTDMRNCMNNESVKENIINETRKRKRQITIWASRWCEWKRKWDNATERRRRRGGKHCLCHLSLSNGMESEDARKEEEKRKEKKDNCHLPERQMTWAAVTHTHTGGSLIHLMLPEIARTQGKARQRKKEEKKKKTTIGQMMKDLYLHRWETNTHTQGTRERKKPQQEHREHYGEENKVQEEKKFQVSA